MFHVKKILSCKSPVEWPIYIYIYIYVCVCVSFLIYSDNVQFLYMQSFISPLLPFEFTAKMWRSSSFKMADGPSKRARLWPGFNTVYRIQLTAKIRDSTPCVGLKWILIKAGWVRCNFANPVTTRSVY